MTEYAILISIATIYIHTTAKKMDTLDTILVLADHHILLLRPFVSSFLLSVVSV